jgi:2-haloacid dehalogenase
MTAKLHGIQACVFDAYGTLFDVNSAAAGAKDVLGEQWNSLAELWRIKQLQYTWLRGLAGHHADFWQVTGDALDFALDAVKREDSELRERLLNSYLTLSAYPEVPEILKRLKDAGMKLAILSNGTPTMLAKAVARAQIDHLLDAVLSVEEVKVYKPHPAVYRLACKRLGLATHQICFISSNGWDAYSAKAFGMPVVWCNRAAQPPERIPEQPDIEIRDLAELPKIVL